MDSLPNKSYTMPAPKFDPPFFRGFRDEKNTPFQAKIGDFVGQ